MKKKSNQGFTLMELLVVVSIIGFLAALVLTSLSSARQKSRNAKRLSDVKQIMTGLELFYNGNGGYPTATGGAPTPANGNPAWSTYISTWPTAPVPVDGTCTAGQNTYTYTSAAVTTYSLTFCLGAVTGGFAAGVRTASPLGIQ